MANTLDYERLLKLRLIVARYGEMDIARWWNTNGVLGRYGSIAVSRGFPNTHPFVRARIVFTAARERCRELFSPPACMTLWQLPVAVEDAMESHWSDWLDDAPVWQPFFTRLEALTAGSLAEILLGMQLISPAQADDAGRLQRSPAGAGVLLPGMYRPDDAVIGLLAAASTRGEPGKPVVPYARLVENA